MREKILSLISCLRINNYIKNLLIFVPFVFGDIGYLDFIRCFENTMWGFVVICLLSSIIYIMNDIRDKEYDRNHPVKSKRPIAAGKISNMEIVCMLAALIISILLCCIAGRLPVRALVILAVYVYINILYSFFLKNITIIDIFTVSSFYLIRIFYGAALVDVSVSSWLFLTVFSLSLYLCAAKRYGEFLAASDKEKPTRKVIGKYAEDYLRTFKNIFLGTTIAFYSLWVIMERYDMFVTVPVVFFTLLRYEYIVDVKKESNPVDVMLGDRWIMGMIMVYIIIVIYKLWEV